MQAQSNPMLPSALILQRIVVLLLACWLHKKLNQGLMYHWPAGLAAPRPLAAMLTPIVDGRGNRLILRSSLLTSFGSCSSSPTITLRAVVTLGIRALLNVDLPTALFGTSLIRRSF